MSLATLGRPPVAPLPELVDGIALRTGGWVVVEQLGQVLAHGAGSGPCPAALVTCLVSKRTTALRSAVTWVRDSRLRGTLDGEHVTAAELGEGATAWFVGAGVEQEDVRLLAAAACDDGRPPTDPLVAELLHPRGPTRAGRAPAALLVVLQSGGALGVLGRAALAAVAGTDARVHSDHDRVVVSLPPGADARRLAAAVRTRCPDAVGGAAQVTEGAADWSATAAVATACARTAASLRLELADADDPAVGAELLVDEAQEAARLLTAHLKHPLLRLQQHDARGGDLLPTLTAWCRAGFDVAATAAQLHVHTNTLRYRLRRAAEISGLDLGRPRHVLALQLLLAV